MLESNDFRSEVGKTSTKDIELYQASQGVYPQEQYERIKEQLKEVEEYKPDSYLTEYMARQNIYGDAYRSVLAPLSGSIAPVLIVFGTILGFSGSGLGWLILPLFSPFIIRMVEKKYGIYGLLFKIKYTKKRKKGSLFWKMFAKLMMTKKQRQIVASMQQEKEEYDTAFELYNILMQKTCIDLVDDLEIVNKYFETKEARIRIDEDGSLVLEDIAKQVTLPKNQELSAKILSRLYKNS